jgi:hypothetical protein
VTDRNLVNMGESYCFTYKGRAPVKKNIDIHAMQEDCLMSSCVAAFAAVGSAARSQTHARHAGDDSVFATRTQCIFSVLFSYSLRQHAQTGRGQDSDSESE